MKFFSTRRSCVVSNTFGSGSTGKTAKRGFIFIGPARPSVHHLEGAGVLFRRKDVTTQTQRCSRERKHTCELAPAENTDRRPGSKQGSIFGPLGHGLGLARTPAIQPLGDLCVR